MNIKSLMMGHSLRKRILSTLTGILLTFVLILTNFAGLYPAEVHAATYTINVTTNKDTIAVFGHAIQDVTYDVTGTNSGMYIGRSSWWTDTEGYSCGNFGAGTYKFTVSLGISSYVYDSTDTYVLNVDNQTYSPDRIETSTSDTSIYYDIPVTITAPPTHTITFDANANGVIGTMPAQSVYEGINTQLNANGFSRSGYSFTGWNINANGGGTGYSNQGSVNLTGDLTLYAQWTQAQTISRTVTFKVVNGSWDDGTTADKTVSYSRYDNEDLVLTLQAGDIPAVGNAPDSGYTAGSWDQIPNTDVSLSADVTYTYTYGGSGPAQAPVSNPTPAPQAATVSTVVTDSVYVSDPLALDGVSFRGGIPYEFKKQVQGPLCIAAFNAQKPAGWNEAFTFNMKRFGYIEDYSLKEGMLTYTVPKEYQKAGREYAIMGIDKNGKVKVFQPIAYAAPYIFFVPIDIEGYAFALIYKD